MKPTHKNLIISTAVFETLFLLLPFCHVFCQSQSDCHPITQCIPQLSVLQMCQPPFCTLNKLCQVDASYCLNILCNNAHLMCEAACTNLKHLCQNQLTSYSSKVLGVTTSEPPPNEEFSRTYSAIITATYSSNAQKNTSYTEAFNKTDSLIIGVIVSCLLLGVACIVICVLWRRKIKRTPHLDKMCSQDSSVTIVRQSLALNNDYDVIQWVSETQDACSEIPREHKDIKTSAKDYELLIEEDSETYEAIDDPDVRADTQEETSVDRNKAGDSGKDNAIINELDGLRHCGTQNKLDEELNISSASTNISSPYFVLDSNCVTEPYFMLDSAFSGVKEPYFELESASTDVGNPHFVLKPLSNDVSNSYYVSESQDKTSNDTENSSDFYSRLGKKKKIKAVNPYNVKLDDNCIVNDNNDNNARNENIDNNDNNCIINNSANNDNNDNNDNKNKDNTENKHENTNDITMTITYNDENDNNGNDNNKDINDTNEECKKSHNDLDPPAPFGS